MVRKPRILLCNEAHFLSTGYSTYGFEVQKYLYQTGKYELAELSAFASENDARLATVPWKCYGNFPANEHGREAKEYWSKRSNEFGEFRFEDVCLRFQPDIVWSIRDHWMDEFIERSPFRDYYRWVYMPTVDSIPQHEQWLATFMNADAVFSYSDWGTKVLDTEGGGLINTVGSAPPGADLDHFYPMDKKELRKKFQFEDDIFVVGTVMRNQGRKLYPELIADFAEFLKQAPEGLARKTFLYLHTSYPDQGWDIPRLIKKNGVSHKILVTYRCKKCYAVFPSFFMDAIGPCFKCGSPAAKLPDVQFGIDRTNLAKIINLFDVYVQYANSEGFGMPQVEAASCGVPVFATDYSAMSDVVRKVHGYPIKVAHYRMDNDFGCLRATPDRQDFIDKLIKFLSKPESLKFEEGKKVRRGVEKNYTWEQTAKKWEGVFDSLLSNTTGILQNQSPARDVNSSGMGVRSATRNIGEAEDTKSSISGGQQKWSITRATGGYSTAAGADKLVSPLPWNSPKRLFHPEKLPSNGFSTNEEMVRWCLCHVLGRPELANSYLAVRLIRDLNWGKAPKNLGSYFNESSFITQRGDLKNFSPEDMVAELTAMREHINQWEERRWETINGKAT
jgi:glycosyltransferase involved in cell wall biosynthesis